MSNQIIYFSQDDFCTVCMRVRLILLKQFLNELLRNTAVNVIVKRIMLPFNE